MKPYCWLVETRDSNGHYKQEILFEEPTTPTYNVVTPLFKLNCNNCEWKERKEMYE